jgi:hypothetical protein
MTEEVTMQPEEENQQEAQQEATQAQSAEEPVVVGDVIAVDPYASQAHLPDENRIWPPPFVKHG